MFVYRGLRNLSTAAVRAKGEGEFFGPLLPSCWPWFSRHGGWEGVARMAREIRIEVGHASWRKEGWVALRAEATGGGEDGDAHGDSDAGGAVVTTKPVYLRSPVGHGASTSQIQGQGESEVEAVTAACGAGSVVVATINYKGGPAIVQLLHQDLSPIPGYSGDGGAARVSGDGVALPLMFGRGPGLPDDVVRDSRYGVRFRVQMEQEGSLLFGLSFRCREG